MADDGESRTSQHSAFAESLRMWRQRLGWTQEDLSEASGLSTRAIRSLERGRIVRPRRTTVQLLADALQVPRTRLLATIRRDDRSEVEELADHGGENEPAHTAEPKAPRQLPAVARATNDRAMAQIVRALHSDARRAALVNFISAAGPETARHAAHHVADLFPDGQLYANLGNDADISPQAILRRFLRALEVRTAEEVPTTESAFVVDELAALLRSRLADQRVLMLLDNAVSAEQISPLITATPGCALLVTSSVALDLGPGMTIVGEGSGPRS